MNRPHYLRHPDGSRIRVQPGNRCDSQRDPSAVYESDLREMEAERIQTGPWQAKADVLDTYIDEPFAKLVAFVCTHHAEFGALPGFDKDETFVGLAEEASKRLDAQIEEHLRSTWGRQPYEPGHYDIAEGD